MTEKQRQKYSIYAQSKKRSLEKELKKWSDICRRLTDNEFRPADIDLIDTLLEKVSVKDLTNLKIEGSDPKLVKK